MLANSFNPATVEGLMCRSTLSVGWMGELFDCDFNQMLEMQMRNGKPLFLWDVKPDRLSGGESRPASLAWPAQPVTAPELSADFAMENQLLPVGGRKHQTLITPRGCGRRPGLVRFAVLAILCVVIVCWADSKALAAAPTTGVTVLVHGLVLFDGASNPPLEYWGGPDGSNLTALLERFGSGLVWLYDPATGLYDNIIHSRDSNGAYRIPRGDWFPAFAGQQILLFDWTGVSGNRESGQAEAAADALFASLIRFRVDGERIIGISPYAAVRPLHFIGHSRGTVVVSETVQRLGRYNIRVNYVTYLDVHDFGQPLIPRDEYFHDPAVQVWENVDHADAVFQSNAPTMCGQNPAGRRLEHFPAQSSLQRDITALTVLTPAGCLVHDRPHAWVKDYYWGTVAANGGFHASRPDVWYQLDGGDGSGRGFGFDRWFANGGYDQPPDRTLERVQCVVGSDAIPFVWEGNLANDRGYADRNTVPPVLFNGDFDLPDLSRGIGLGFSLAGWSGFGGGGSAFVRPLIVDPPPGAELPNSYLVLRDGSLVARHNRFFLPPEAGELRFAMSVPFVPFTPLQDHVLEVRIGNRVVRRFTVAETSGFEVRTVNLKNHPDLLGGVNTLTFELFTVPGATGLTARVQLDNISIVVDSVGWIHSVSRTQEEDWRIDWRAWPAATFFLESSADLPSADWQPVSHNSTAGTAGSFAIPNDGDAAGYFRGRVVPAR